MCRDGSWHDDARNCRLSYHGGYAPNNPMLHESKGLFMLKLGNIDEALDLYDRVWELDHDFFIHYTSDFYDELKEQGLI